MTAARWLNACLVLCALGVTTAPLAAQSAPGAAVNRNDGSDVFVKYLGGSAALRDDLYFFYGIGNNAQFLFRNGIPVLPLTGLGIPGNVRQLDLTGVPSGGELIFGICTGQTGIVASPANCNASNTFYSGDRNRNPDQVGHSVVYLWTQYRALHPNLAPLLNDQSYTWVLAFEDGYGGGDEDYNDLVFAIKGVTAAPEPATMGLLAFGLATLSGAGVTRRRRAMARKHLS